MRSFEGGATAEHVPTERVPRPVYDTTDIVVAAPQEVARAGSAESNGPVSADRHGDRDGGGDGGGLLLSVGG